MSEIVERRTGHYSRGSLYSLILFTLFFIPHLLGLIGFNVLLFYSTTDYVLGEIIKLARYLALPVNAFLIFMTVGLGIPFVLAWRKFIRYRSPKNKLKYSIPEVEQKILQILADNKGKSLSRLVIIRKVNFPGTMKEFTEILNNLWQEEKIKREFQDYPKYSAM